MRGVVFTGGRELELMEFPDPTPGPDEVVVEMKASGMCGTGVRTLRASQWFCRRETAIADRRVWSATR
jgi:threonine dehydrogenase-like Zn-dependent dehydrogenase